MSPRGPEPGAGEAGRGREASAQVTGLPGPEGSFEGFFEAERVKLFRMLCAVTGNRHEAEELTQDAFLAVWERWDRVEAMEDPVGYLYRTAMNAFRKRYRRAKVAARKALGLVSSQDAYEAVDARSVLAQVLDALSPRQRAAIVVTELLDYSAEEAGSLLGIKASTVRALAFQARKALHARGEPGDG